MVSRLLRIGSRSYRNDRLHRPHILPRALASGCGWARNAKNPSRVREVCARVEDDGVRPYLVVRGGHCGPARLLPIIMANESTVAVWHRPPPRSPSVSGCEHCAGHLRCRTNASVPPSATRWVSRDSKTTVRPSPLALPVIALPVIALSSGTCPTPRWCPPPPDRVTPTRTRRPCRRR